MDFSKFDLPVADIIGSTKEALSKDNTLIVTAPPGAGKSTLLPLAWLDLSQFVGKKILMLEPRRLAARTIATRMSDMLGEQVGQTVGYRIRFESKVSASTRIEILTEGILTRMLQSDNELKGVAAVIFDEFHERSLFADVAMALCRECQQVLRPDLRIVVMSATLDVQGLSSLLSASVIECCGRQFPVEIIYNEDCDAEFVSRQTAQTILRATREHDGDVLAFLPGEAEIRQCEAELKTSLPGGICIHPLYGMLPWAKQYAAIMPDRQGRRKVVLATSIAETSLTIEGISIVVDSGFCRTQRFDPNTGLSHLETLPITCDMADQRAGRAGRLCSGVCYRMWTHATHDHKTLHRTPEIEDADLAPLVLDLALWGETDASHMTWLTPPPVGHLLQAKDLLFELDAVDEDGNITDYGKVLQRIPCHPRIAQMLTTAENMNMLPLATDLAALLDEKDPLPKETGIDINIRIEALRQNRSRKLGKKAFDRIERAASQYRSLFHADVDNGTFDSFDTGVLLVQAYPERIASARPGNNALFQLSNGSLATAGHTDDLAHEPWLAVASLNARDGIGRIFLASPLDPKDLKSMVKMRENISWNTKQGGLIAQQELRIGSIVLQSKPIPNVDKQLAVDVVCNAIRHEGESILGFSDKTVQLQNRLLSLRHWHPEKNWPDMSTENLIATCDKWLAPYLSGIRSAEALKRLDIYEPLLYSVDYEYQQLLNKLAPTYVEVPSGSHISLQYQANGSAPILAVRLQELFGLTETPTVDAGNRHVLIHLLSPGFKLVQITADLKSFWNNAYFDVKKEMKARYPKHVWPDDPWTEPAIKGVKRRK